MASSDKVSLNRSFSSPDIPSSYLVSRRVVFEETYQSPRSHVPLIRQYSFEEMYGRKPISSFSRFENDFIRKTCKETPMDVDSSDGDDHEPVNTSIKDKYDKVSLALDKKRCDSDGSKFYEFDRTIDETDDCRTARKIPMKANAKTARSWRYFLEIAFKASLILTVIISVYYNYPNEPPLVKTDAVINHVVGELKKNIMCQDAAMTIVTKNLWYLDSNNNDGKRILAFVGSTGVGKSYTANIIKKHLPMAVVHEVNESNLKEISESDRIMASIRYDRCNLIVIDNLRSDDAHDVVRFVGALPKTCLLFVPIFNIQETRDGYKHVINTDDIWNITDKLKEFYGGADIAVFDVITPDAMVPWLERQLIAMNVNGNRKDIIDSILREHDTEFKGFKGVHAKLNLFVS